MEEEIKKLVSINSWFISLQILTLIAVLVTTSFIYYDLRGIKKVIPTDSAQTYAPSKIDNWTDFVRDHDPSIGNKSAGIVVVEFTDFQCPFCKAFTETTRKDILSKYGDRVRFVFKHLPLETIHSSAKQAALAAQCAHREKKFWEIKDLLFSNQDKLSTEFLIQTGMSLGLSKKYFTCLSNKETQAEVDQDMQDAQKLGIRGTPTLLINGKVIVGVISLAQFESSIEERN